MINFFEFMKNKRYRTYKNIDYFMLKNIVAANRNAYIIDVRQVDEFKTNHIEGAYNIPLQNIEQKIENIVKDKSNTIVVYCEYGGRSLKACRKLEKLGYTNVYNLQGGMSHLGTG